MRQIRNIRMFNIIEIAFTLAFLGLAVTAVMAIFPMGFSITKETMQQNHASDIADQVFGYVQEQASRSAADWDAMFGAPVVGTPRIADYQPFLPNLAEIGNPHAEPGKWMAVCNDQDARMWYEKTGYNDPTDENWPKDLSCFVFYIERGTTISGGNSLIELTALATIWCSGTPSLSTDSSGNRCNVIFIKVAWPADASSSDRKSLLFCKPIFNPN